MSAAAWAEPRSGSLSLSGTPGVRECPGGAHRPLVPGAVADSGVPGSKPGSLEALTAPLTASGAPVGTRGPRSRPGPSASLLGPFPTPRELEIEILNLASHGLADPQIARRLGLPQRTVRERLTRLYSRLGVRNRAAAVAAGFRCGLLTPGPVASGAVPSLEPRLALLLPLVAAGLTNDEIAVSRSLTPAVARNRMLELRRALGAASREHAVRLGVESGSLVASADRSRLVLAAPPAGGASC